jgi:hypothetical protein
MQTDRLYGGAEPTGRADIKQVWARIAWMSFWRSIAAIEREVVWLRPVEQSLCTRGIRIANAWVHANMTAASGSIGNASARVNAAVIVHAPTRGAEHCFRPGTTHLGRDRVLGGAVAHAQPTLIVRLHAPLDELHVLGIDSRADLVRALRRCIPLNIEIEVAMLPADPRIAWQLGARSANLTKDGLGHRSALGPEVTR